MFITLAYSGQDDDQAGLGDPGKVYRDSGSLLERIHFPM